MYYSDRAEKFGGFTASSLSSIVQDFPGKMKTRGKMPIRLIRYSHTIRCTGEREKKASSETDEHNLYANAFIFYPEYEQSMDACRGPVVVASSTPLHNERTAGYQYLRATNRL